MSDGRHDPGPLLVLLGPRQGALAARVPLGRLLAMDLNELRKTGLDRLASQRLLAVAAICRDLEAVPIDGDRDPHDQGDGRDEPDLAEELRNVGLRVFDLSERWPT